MAPGWLGSGWRGFFSGSYFLFRLRFFCCPYSPKPSCGPGMHTSKLSSSSSERIKRKADLPPKCSFVVGLPNKTFELNVFAISCHPFRCEFLEAQGCACHRKGRSKDPIAYLPQELELLGRAGPPAVLPGAPSVQMIQLEVQMDRVGLGMCCPDQAVPEAVC